MAAGLAGGRQLNDSIDGIQQARCFDECPRKLEFGFCSGRPTATFTALRNPDSRPNPVLTTDNSTFSSSSIATHPPVMKTKGHVLVSFTSGPLLPQKIHLQVSTAEVGLAWG
jgi:hypothetical protein